MKKIAKLVVFGTALAAACLGSLAQAQGAYPQKPIKLVVPFPAGGSIDLVARIVAPKLSANLGQTVLVDNRPGASGNVGMDFVAKAPKDGYTLLMVHAGLASNAHMFAKLPYSPAKDLTPIIQVANQPSVLIISPKLPFKTINELVAHAKANPGKLSFGTSGVGGPQDVAARMFAQMTGTQMLDVHYRGGAPALNDLMGGQIDLMFETSPTAVPFAKSGKVRALGVTNDKRLSTIPELPTIGEAGVPNYKYLAWVGLVAPTGTPAAVVEMLNKQVQGILATPEVRNQLTEQSLEVAGGSVADFRSFLQKESDYYAKFVKDFNITPQ